MRIELPHEQRGDGRADGLAVLSQPAALPLDVAFEVEVERRGDAHALEDEEERADAEQDDQQADVHVAADGRGDGWEIQGVLAPSPTVLRGRGASGAWSP